MRKLINFIILKLINGRPFVANITLIDTLAVDIDESADGDYINISVKKNHDRKIPDAAFYFAADVNYKN